MPDFRLIEYRALAEFRFQIRRFLHFSDEQARAHGIEPGQHQLLLAIKGLPPGAKATIGELATRLQLRHHSTVELANRLAARGFVEREHSLDDRRQVLLRLTREGTAVLRGLSVAHREALEKSGPLLARALRRLARRPL